MAKVNVSELSGIALNWAVAQAEILRMESDGEYVKNWWKEQQNESPDDFVSDWAIVGEIIEREGIAIRKLTAAKHTLLECRHYDASKGDIIKFNEFRKKDMVVRPCKPHPLEGMWLATCKQTTDILMQWNKDDNISRNPRTAALRCYVSLKLGASVDVPESILAKPI